MRTIVKHILLITAALSLVSCRKDTVPEKWMLAEYSCKSGKLDLLFTHKYDSQGHLTQVTEEMKGALTVHVMFVYDQNTITRYLVADPTDLKKWAGKIVYTLDNSGRVIKSVDEVLEETLVYSYSPNGFLEKVTEEDGNVTVYTWKNNSLEKITRSDGITVNYTYSNKESLGLLSANKTEKGDHDLAQLGYFGKNSRLLPAKIEELSSEGKVVSTEEYNYTEFDASARLTGYTQTTSHSAGTLQTKTTNTYKLIWKPQ